MPRTWFSWTDSVLLGSNKLFIVSEMTVPGLRHAKQLVAAIRERLGDGPQPQVIVNRFEQKMFSSGLRKPTSSRCSASLRRLRFPNNYALVREAIDRGVPLDEVKPGNKITLQLKKLMLPQPAPSRPPQTRPDRRSSSCAGRADARHRRTGPVIEEQNGRPFHRTRVPRRRSRCRPRKPSPALEGVSWTVFPEPRSRPSRPPPTPIRCSPTSCSTPRCACIAG